MRQRFIPRPVKKRKPWSGLLSVKAIFSGAKPDTGLVASVFGLLAFGWVMVYSASAMHADVKYHSQFFFLKRQFIWSMIGLLGFVMASNLPLTFWQKAAKPAFVITCLALVAVLIIGPKISGARRWLRFGGFNIQPSEVAKIVLILVTADYLDRRQSRLGDFKRGLLPLLSLIAVPIGLILVEPDLGTPMLMMGVLAGMMLIGGVRLRHLCMIGLAAAPVVVIAVLQHSYRVARLFAYLNPWADAKGTGYQLVQSLLAMGSGGLFGRGLGNSQIKISSLPDAHTDFIFGILGEELGLLGTLSCAGLFLFLFLRGFRTARMASNTFARLTAAGISLLIGLQALINMSVACGLFPTKGMPLPFISFGGSSLVITLGAVAILASISRHAAAKPREAAA